MCANFALLFIKKINIWLHIHAKSQRQDVESGKAKVWPYMAANLIYTFSYGSIGSCHVCTTRAVRLCVLALLWPLCRDIGLAPKSRWHLFCTESKRQFFFLLFLKKMRKRGRVSTFDSTRTKETNTELWSIWAIISFPLWFICGKKKKSLGTCSHWITRRFSHWLLIGEGGHHSRKATEQHMRAARTEQRRSIFQQLCKVTQRPEPHRCLKWQLRLV